MSNVNARPIRCNRCASPPLFVPPPLPLINLPDESRVAQTGLPGERPSMLPVRKHLPSTKASVSPSVLNHLQRLPPEPILQEDSAVIDAEALAYNDSDVLERLCVYEYNHPRVFHESHAPDDTLVFDSLFESGNLSQAVRVFRNVPRGTGGSHHEYELVIHPDVKNQAYRQWFYFEVRNGRPGTTYRFALVNLAKTEALFGQGLQPVVYSEIDAATKGVGWRHGGTHVRYDTAGSSRAPLGANALTFHYEFEHGRDCVYFACLQPYTYTDLMDYLEQLERDPYRMGCCRRTELCRTLAGNVCDLLTITSPDKDGLLPEDRRIIVLSARVHPGEPNSSWMMKGIIDYLTGPTSGATLLRQHFVFKLVPMLNPDGVINGNTRVSLAGADLNRKWRHPVEPLFPTIYHLKQQLAHFQTRNRVALFCDLHGHSLHRNIFMYGCRRKSSSSDGKHATRGTDDPRVFPMIVARHAPCFSFASCNFSVQKAKATTARVVVNQELGVTNSYTLEASFCGPNFGTYVDTQFSTDELEDMGRAWCQSLLVYYGLTSQVQALEAEREGLAKQQEVVTRQHGTTQSNEALMREDVEDGTRRLERDFLLDCEAAVSALSTDDDRNDNVDFGEHRSPESEESGAEEIQRPHLGHEHNGNGLVSIELKSSEDYNKKHCQKFRPLSQSIARGEKGTRRKRRQLQIRRANSAVPTVPLRAQPDRALPSKTILGLAPQRGERAAKALFKPSLSLARTKSMSARSTRSSKTSRSASSALFHPAMNADVRAGAMDTKTSLRALPNVLIGTKRTLAYQQRYLNRDEHQIYFNLARIRDELPRLQSSHGDHTLRRQSSRDEGLQMDLSTRKSRSW